jgi:hypothetical protein
MARMFEAAPAWRAQRRGMPGKPPQGEFFPLRLLTHVVSECINNPRLKAHLSSVPQGEGGRHGPGARACRALGWDGRARVAASPGGLAEAQAALRGGTWPMIFERNREGTGRAGPTTVRFAKRGEPRQPARVSEVARAAEGTWAARLGYQPFNHPLVDVRMALI